MSQPLGTVAARDDYHALISRSVQMTAEACAAWAAGDWDRGALLILQATDLETAALRAVLEPRLPVARIPAA